MEIETRGDGLTVRTPAKINLYLEVSEARADGFHDIDSVFQAISLYDEIDLLPDASGEIRLEEAGIDEGKANLVWRAADALRRHAFGAPDAGPGVRIRLRKQIPHGSGLGGGSSDAAATLVALARLWRLSVSAVELAEIGARLGSDVPFFLYGGTARCQGRGEKVTPWHDEADRAPPLHYVLVCPGVHTPTRDVYQALDRSRGEGFALTRSSPLDSLRVADCMSRLARGDLLFNRLEATTCELFPRLKEIGSRMRTERFLGVQMTGSGSAFFGLCRSVEDAVGLTHRLESGLPPVARVIRARSLPGFRFPWLAG